MKYSILLILIFAFTAFGQKNLVTVSVEISADNKTTSDAVESYITRELRSLGDVEVTNSNSFYAITIIVLNTKNNNGQNIGYTLSTVVSHQSTCHNFQSTSTYPCYVYDDNYLNLSDTDSLRRTCERIVTKFDNDSMKPLRKK